MSRPREKQGYHHGDLRRSLIEQGLILVREVGIEALSLRQLAERVGVSTPALYHHFRNKQALLAALGEAGIVRFEAALHPALMADCPVDAFVLAYVRFARDNPQIYELVFGGATWRNPEADDFRLAARHSVRVLGEHLQRAQRSGRLPAEVNVLRLIQVGWATLHGLCRMYNDGLAFTPETIEDIARHAVLLLRTAIGMHQPAP